VHSHASHRRRRSRSASPLPLPPPRRRPPPPPPTAAHPRRATSRSGRGGTGSRGSSLRRRQDAGERHPEWPDVRVHPWPPEEGEEEPVAAFTTAARLAGVPFGRRCGWKDWKKRAVAASVGRRPVALAGATRTAVRVSVRGLYGSVSTLKVLIIFQGTCNLPRVPFCNLDSTYRQSSPSIATN
jgi:hypothetical protein